MKQRLLFILLGFFFLISFYLFSGFVRDGKLKKVSFDTTVRLQEKMPKRLESILDDVTFFGGPEVSVLLVLILTGIAFIEIKKKKVVLAALLIPLLFFFLVVGEMYGKQKVESPAPPFFLLKNPTTLFPKYHVQEQYSYPSGHAARTIFLAMVATSIVYRKTRKLKHAGTCLCLLTLLSVLIATGKVYLGQHWLSDIIGGYFFAFGLIPFFLAAYLPIIKFPNINFAHIIKSLPIAELEHIHEENPTAKVQNKKK